MQKPCKLVGFALTLFAVFVQVCKAACSHGLAVLGGHFLNHSDPRRDYRGVSLAITGASHSRLQGRLTRDYKADQVAISGNCDFRKNCDFRCSRFFHKKIWKNPENHFFGLLGPK